MNTERPVVPALDDVFITNIEKRRSGSIFWFNEKYVKADKCKNTHNKQTIIHKSFGHKESVNKMSCTIFTELLISHPNGNNSKKGEVHKIWEI